MDEEQKDPVVEDVRRWVRKGGFPLEHEVEIVFSRVGFHTRLGVHYDDVDEPETRREIDLVALRYGAVPIALADREPWVTRVSLGCFVESKHASKDPKEQEAEDLAGRHWVARTSARHLTPPAKMVLPVASSLGRYALRRFEAEIDMSRLLLLRRPERPAFAVVSAHLPKKATDPCYAALHAATKAAWSWVPQPVNVGFPLECFIGVPVVVTDNNLVECWFEGDEDDPRIERREHVQVYWHGATRGDRFTRVDVVARPFLETFATEMWQTCGYLLGLLEEHAPRWAAEMLNDSSNAGINFGVELQKREWEWGPL
jgi:hypothetical protein